MDKVFLPLFLSTLLSIIILDNIIVNIYLLLIFIILFFIFSLFTYYKNKIKISYIFMIISISLLLGFNYLKSKNDYIEKSNYSIPSRFYIDVVGVITSFPVYKEDKTFVDIQTEKIEYERKIRNNTINIKVAIKGKSDNICKGDRIRIGLKVSKRVFAENFSVNPIKKYFMQKKIHFTASCKSPYLIEIKNKNLFWSKIEGIRNRIKFIINKTFTKKSEENKRGFLKAILLGDRSEMTEELKEELLNIGVYHIFAISGAHIGIISLIIFYLFKLLGVNMRLSLFINAIILIFYLIVSGANISTQRAVITALFILFAKFFYLKTDVFNIISLSGIINLLINPLDILNAGFILTYTLSAGIVIGRNIFLRIFNKLPNYTAELISASISAFLLSLPLSLLYFNRFSLIGFISSIVLIPLTFVILGISFSIFIFSFSEFISILVLKILTPCLDIFFFIVEKVLNVFNATIYRATPSVVLIIIYMLMFFLLSYMKFDKYKKIFVIVFIILTVFFLIPDKKYIPENIEVCYLDVGQGDSELIIFSDGKTLLIDGGGVYFSSYEVGKKILLPFLLNNRIKVDWIAVSHTHPDHVRGIIEIADIIKPSEVWLSQTALKDQLYRKLIAKKNIKFRYIDSKFRIYGKGYKVECLYPFSIINGGYTMNNNSQVLKITAGKNSFLFTGDIEKETEKILVEKYGKDLKSTVLKVPHHGSKTSSTMTFLNLVKPPIAIFSYKRYNHFGFPHKEVLENYKRIQSKTFSTAKNGGIKIILNNKGDIIVEKTRD